MMAIAPVVPHYLMGIAAGAGLLGLFMIVCGFFQPLGSMPKPIFRYPLSYMAFHTYAFNGMMKNEFPANSLWGCPCEAMEGGCFSPNGTADPNCQMTGNQVLQYYDMDLLPISKWISFVVLIGWVVFYRTMFFATLRFKERKSK